jgi:large subunit ribosomal protein L35
MAKLKQKTKSAAKKRFKMTASGHAKRSRAYHNHILEHKSAKQGARLRKAVLVHESDMDNVRRMLVL